MLIPAAALTGAAGCLLPWVHARVHTTEVDSTLPLNGLHGIGVVACAGAVVALLAAGHRLWWGGSPSAEAAVAAGGTLMLAGALLSLTPLGQPLGTGRGDSWSIRLGPGLPLTAAAGALLLLSCLLAAWSRRGG